MDVSKAADDIGRLGEVDPTIAVLGAGGAGSWAALALAAAGVRRFRLLDQDVVELANLDRQVCWKVALNQSADTLAL